MDDSIKKALEGLSGTSKLVEAFEQSLGSKELLKKLGGMTPRIPELRLPAIEAYQPRPIELPEIPTQEELNEYQSASVLMEALAREATLWKEQMPEGFRPAILAVLYGGMQVNVQSLSQVTFHGIRIEGTMNGCPCSLFAHQSTVQILCYAEEVKPDTQKRPIGFVWENNRVEV